MKTIHYALSFLLLVLVICSCKKEPVIIPEPIIEEPDLFGEFEGTYEIVEIRTITKEYETYDPNYPYPAPIITVTETKTDTLTKTIQISPISETKDEMLVVDLFYNDTLSARVVNEKLKIDYSSSDYYGNRTSFVSSIVVEADQIVLNYQHNYQNYHNTYSFYKYANAEGTRL